MESNKAMLRQLTDKVVWSDERTASNISNEQSTVVGLGMVESWLGKMIGEMKSLSNAPARVVTGTTTSFRFVPNFDNCGFCQPSSSFLVFGVSGSTENAFPGLIQLTMIEFLLPPGYSQLEADNFRQLGAFSISG